MNDLSVVFQNNKTLLSDGATGTNLQQRGLERGTPPEVWVLEKPEEIIKLNRDFIEAGSNILLTCTFGASPIRLAQNDLEGKTTEINQKAVMLTKKSTEGTQVLIAGSMGPLGHILMPYGDLAIETAKHNYKEQALALDQAGIDFFLVESQFDLNEVKIALQAIQEVSSRPIICSFSYDRGTRTMMGVKPSQTVKELESFRLLSIGINCGKSLEDNLNSLIELRQSTQLPIWFKPNAGLPKLDDSGKPIYDITPETMGNHVHKWINAGANIIGGCCGTSPAHLKSIADAMNNK
jgi:5-methyltetrahydrofolate--homocysteine methyltransferase